MEFELANYFTIGNVLLAFIFLLVLNQLIELYQFRNMPPGPRMTILPLIGNVLSFDSTKPGEGFVMTTSSLRKKYGNVFSIKVGGFKVVVIEDSNAVKEVLIKRSADYAGRPPFTSWLLFSLGGKDILLGNYGPAWRFHRKLFMAALRQCLSNHQLVEERISEQADRVLQYIDEQYGNDFDPSPVLLEGVANVISRITCGNHFDSSHPDFDELLQILIFLLTDVDLNKANLLLDFFPLAKYLPLKNYRVVWEKVSRSFEILRGQLKAQEEVFDPSSETDSLVTSLLKEKVEAAVEISANERASLLSDDYILNTIKDMFAAGYETTSNTLRWAIAFLVNNPEIQQQVQNELNEEVGRDRMPNLDDRPKLPLLQATIMEVQRLANVIEFVPHYTLKETAVGSYRVPKDTVVMINLGSVHTDPNCWDNPTEFDPHRHIDSSGQLITNSGNFLPFSAGRRGCAGESLAKVELFLFLSWMLHKFTFLPAKEEGLPDLNGVTGFTRYPVAYKIRAEKRK